MRHSSLIVNSTTCDLMVTAQLQVMNKNNEPIKCRALLDTCSTVNFITERLAADLQLPRQTCEISIGALNTMSTATKYLVKATVRSRLNGFTKNLHFLTVPRITQLVPDQHLDRNAINIPRNLKLADPAFQLPAPVDILLGSGPTLSALCVGKIELTSPGEPDLYLQKTLFGWVIGGSAPSSRPSRQSACYVNTSELTFNLARFWEIEEAANVRHLSEDEAACEAHFSQHTSRNSTGRYVVALPFNENYRKMGESRSRALKRLQSTERKLRHDPELGAQYRAVLQEYIDLGHMTEVDPSNPSDRGFYLPHHSVVKEGSLTTKVRVVFDGSAKTSSGLSLNDALRVGPTIQDDIMSLLLRFRLHRYVLTGDIEKMYRQILVRPEDRKFQRIVWRPDDGPVRTYEMNTVTFGLSAAPYLAIRSLHQLADDEGHQHPRAAHILKRDLYVDDLLTGAQTKAEAIALRDEIDKLLKRGGFNLRQWASNDNSLLDGLPDDSVNLQLQLGDSSTIKTLGVFWDSATDNIKYSVKNHNTTDRITKRHILSETAKIFDPLGILGPVVIIAKMLIQRLWTIQLHWDSTLPTEIHSEWVQFYRQLTLLNNFSIRRATLLPEAEDIQLHGFCDASLSAYGACVYLRTVDKCGAVSCRLLCAKSRVAPLKQLTIPRLELCGAKLLKDLVMTVKSSIHVNVERVVYWTDSTVVLHWLNTSPQRLLTFVANRVAEIQAKTDIKDWRHVRTNDNPADQLSRGRLPEDFMKPSIWCHGPAWLQAPEDLWPTISISFPPTPMEQRKMTCLATTHLTEGILTRFSNFMRLQRVLAYCIRFRTRIKGQLRVSEIREAHKIIMRLVQAEAFPTVLKLLREGSPQHKKRSELAKLASLCPFVDRDGIMRVGGRLKNANLPFDRRHPIILPKKHHVTRLIIEHEHRTQLHAGAQATLYAVRLRYWLLDGRNVIRHSIRSCVKCIRMNPPQVNYVMGNLPSARVMESRPFTNVGVDYCGPFFVKEKRYRNRGRIKVYVAVFICLAVKAVHLEVVSDLTTAAFLAALRRFIGRRGSCTNIYSDNGTNFVGAHNELREVYKHLQAEDLQGKVQAYLASKDITWHFTPPSSPHFGGLWEAAVKGFKHHLKRVIGNELITFEDLNTLAIEIEAVLNSRPLTPMSSDPHDASALTPGHFLIGDALTSPREPDYRETPNNRLSSWQHVQKMKQQFWTRWHREYISELNQRTKWSMGEHQIEVGALVLLKEDNLPALQWALGRIIDVHPGTDGVIRAVTVKTSKGEFLRNVRKLAPLPPTDDDEQIRASNPDAAEDH